MKHHDLSFPVRDLRTTNRRGLTIGAYCWVSPNQISSKHFYCGLSVSRELGQTFVEDLGREKIALGKCSDKTYQVGH